jgi:hypothetical protein
LDGDCRQMTISNHESRSWFEIRPIHQCTDF